MTVSCAFIVQITILTIHALAQAQDGRYSYEELAKGADVIVIARAKSTRDAGNDAERDREKITVLEIRVVLKGDVREKEIELMHGDPKRPERMAKKVVFGTNDIDVSFNQNATGIVNYRPEYLCFLKKTNGRFVLVSERDRPNDAMRLVTPAYDFTP